MRDLILSGTAALDELRNGLAAKHPRLYGVEEVSWYAPVRTPSKVVCLALNNRALDAIKIRATDGSSGLLSQTVHRPHRPPKPRFGCASPTGSPHPEPELAVVIGQTLSNATPEQAMAAVYGYSIVNDITSVGMREQDSFSVRYFKPGPKPGETTPGEAHTTYPGRYKASDTFAPMGPWLVTRDEIPDPATLRIQCRLGERLVASDHTKNYVWGCGAGAVTHFANHDAARGGRRLHGHRRRVAMKTTLPHRTFRA